MTTHSPKISHIVSNLIPGHKPARVPPRPYGGMASERKRNTRLSCSHFSQFDGVVILVREGRSRLGIGMAPWCGRGVRDYRMAPPGCLRLWARKYKFSSATHGENQSKVRL